MENQVCLRVERLHKAEVLGPEAAGPDSLTSTVYRCTSWQNNDLHVQSSSIIQLLVSNSEGPDSHI